MGVAKLSIVTVDVSSLTAAGVRNVAVGSSFTESTVIVFVTLPALKAVVPPFVPVFAVPPTDPVVLSQAR